MRAGPYMFIYSNFDLPILNRANRSRFVVWGGTVTLVSIKDKCVSDFFRLDILFSWFYSESTH